jgi:hypothetical protein
VKEQNTSSGKELTRREIHAGLSLGARAAHSGTKQKTKQQDTHARSNVNQVAALGRTHPANPRQRCQARKEISFGGTAMLAETDEW